MIYSFIQRCFSADPEIASSAASPSASLITPAVEERLPEKISKAEIRTSLRASTLDGLFATIFSNITGGVIISNFLVELEATAFQIGMLAAIPMLANLLQPLGAYWSDRTTSRQIYGLWVYGISRLLWLPLAIAIIGLEPHPAHPQRMIVATLAVMLVTHLLGAIGSASWLSWLATLVPRQLRGRYFGFRNSIFSLTSFVALPLLGLVISHWRGGSIQGFGIMMVVGVVAGWISLAFQTQMTDVNPQAHYTATLKSATAASAALESATLAATTLESATVNSTPVTSGTLAVPRSEPAMVDQSRAMDSPSELLPATLSVTSSKTSDDSALSSASTQTAVSTKAVHKTAHSSILKDVHFLLYLLYFAVWAFGVNLSNPFFNLYLLDNLALDLSWVSVYNALAAGANLLMLLIWGRLADRIGNRPILLLDGLLVAVTPLLWLGTDASSVSVWLWFPLLHLLGGGTGAAIDLCINNLQLAIAPVQHHTKYFAIAAAIGGVAGAGGALAGGWLAQFTAAGGMTGVFALSSILRLLALLPLVWLKEPQRRSIRSILQSCFGKSELQPEASD